MYKRQHIYLGLQTIYDRQVREVLTDRCIRLQTDLCLVKVGKNKDVYKRQVLCRETLCFPLQNKKAVTRFSPLRLSLYYAFLKGFCFTPFESEACEGGERT